MFLTNNSNTKVLCTINGDDLINLTIEEYKMAINIIRLGNFSYTNMKQCVDVLQSFSNHLTKEQCYSVFEILIDNKERIENE